MVCITHAHARALSLPPAGLGKLTNMAAGYNNFAAGPGPGRGVENLIAQLRLEHRARSSSAVHCVKILSGTLLKEYLQKISAAASHTYTAVSMEYELRIS